VTISALKVYRKANSMMAMWRDDCKCAMCGATADESDHVFGRGTESLILLEHWILRMSLCQPCHYKKHHGGGFDAKRQVQELEKTNECFFGEKVETCYMAINQDIAMRMFDDTGAALEVIEQWLASNG